MGGWALGKTAYSKINPLPENASVIYSNQASQTDSLNLVVFGAVSYTHLRAHETVLDLVCRLLLEKKNKKKNKQKKNNTQ